MSIGPLLEALRHPIYAGFRGIIINCIEGYLPFLESW
jgi:hypothetical protein